MTPERFYLVMAIFHALALAGVWRVAAQWVDPARCTLPARPWLWALARDLVALALVTYLVALLAAVVANLDSDLRRLHLGPISERLMGQALFGEAILLGFVLAWRHGGAARSLRAATLTLAALALLAVYVEAYRLEPGQLRLRRHVLTPAALAPGSHSIRILHITDIQTPAIGAHEERALRTGLAQKPDLIVLTGDYVQDALGRPSERQAVRDLRELMARVGFQAPLGVFATDGDVGPTCREVFAGTAVRCLVDDSALTRLPWGGSLAVTGLSRGTGREREPVRLARLMMGGPQADHRIVISHAPDFVDRLPWPVDLALAGHTHGGQVVLPLFGPPKTASRLPRRYAGGLHDYRGTPLHVSRGVGMERGFAPPVRFLCPPEVCVLELPLAKQAS